MGLVAAPGRGGDRRSNDKMSLGTPAYADQTSESLGVNKRTVERDLRRGKKIAPEALKVVAGTDMDTGAVYRAQADALEIEAGAKRRLADEYDAAQERGDVATRGGERSGREHSPPAPSAADLGLTRKDVHEARLVRDAEVASPGVVQRPVQTLAIDRIVSERSRPPSRPQS